MKVGDAPSQLDAITIPILQLLPAAASLTMFAPQNNCDGYHSILMYNGSWKSQP